MQRSAPQQWTDPRVLLPLVAALLLAAYLAGSIAGAAPPSAVQAAPAAQPSSTEPPGIAVNGEATAVATPDVAYVSVGVQTQAGTAQEAQSRNNETMQRVLDAIKGQGVPDSDIKTSGLSLSPIYARENQITGYRAVNTVRVTVNDINKAGPVLDAAIGAGANTAGSISFSVKDQTGPYAQALAEAMRQSRAKAEAVAEAMGTSIVGVHSVQEESSIPSPRFEAAASAAAAPAPAPTPVQPGELNITARVRVIYLFR